MTTGNKLAKLRKEKGYTQEQLAEILGVSRQSISKWESDTAYPETEKLIRLGELYGCSMDYLLKEEIEDAQPIKQTHLMYSPKSFYYEYKSKKTYKGLPLCHINICLGRSARGIVAIGLASKGIISLGILSLGILSFGVLSLGIFALGAFALGVISAGALSAGIIAFGAIALGIISVGGVAIGFFSVGGVAVGNYLAIGDRAFGKIALGETKMISSYFGVSPYYNNDLKEAAFHLDSIVPVWLWWAKELIKSFLI